MESKQNKLFTIFHGIQSLWWTNYITIKQDLLDGVRFHHPESLIQIQHFLTQLHNHIVLNDKDFSNTNNLLNVKDSPLKDEKRVMVLTEGAPIMRDKTEIPFFPDEEWDLEILCVDGLSFSISGDRFALVSFFEKTNLSPPVSINLKIKKTGNLRDLYEQKLRYRLLEEKSQFINYVKMFLLKDLPQSMDAIQRVLKDFKLPLDPQDIHLNSLDIESLNDLRDNLSIINGGLMKDNKISQKVHQEWTKTLYDKWKKWTNQRTESI